mgnify:CR=1 FL=1
MRKTCVAFSVLTISVTGAAGALAYDPDLGAPVEQQPTQQFESLVQSYNILGKDLKGAEGEDLGKITQILIEPESGQAAYVLVTTGGLLEIGEAERLVPWSALQVGPDNTVSIDLTANQFEQAPVGATVASPQDAEKIHRYYGVSPYWQQQTGQPAGSQMQPQATPQSDRGTMPEQQQEGQQQQMQR